MKILFDHQIFQQQKFGGISRYYYEIVNRFNSQSTQFTISIKYSNNSYLNTIPRYKEDIKAIPHNYVKSKNKYFQKIKSRLFPPIDYRRINKTNSIEHLLKTNFDIFHPTYYDDYFLEYLNNKPFVLTVHDLTHETFPEYFPLNDKALLNKKRLLEKASAIIAVSHNTKRDIINFYKIDPEKVSVIYHGSVLNQDFNCETDNYQLPEKYILYVGQRSLYKNFYFFLMAIMDILKKNNIYMICAGSSFSKEEEILFKNNDLQHHLISIQPSDSVLKILYRNALALAYPSLYEGFGIPCVEAFSLGCPVLASNSSCLPEICADAAIYYDPKKQESIRASLIRLLSSEQLQKEMRIKGLKRALLFNWDDTVEKILTVYKHVV